MSRFLVACSVSLFCILSAGLFGVSSASATSPFDDAYQITDELFIGMDYSNYNLKKTDVSLDLTRALAVGNNSDEQEWAKNNFGVSQVRYYNKENRATSTEIDNFVDLWLNKKERWSITQQVSDLQSGHEIYSVRIYGTTDDSLALGWDAWSGGSGVYVDPATSNNEFSVIVETHNGMLDVFFSLDDFYVNSSYALTISSGLRKDDDQMMFRNFLTFSDHLNYPVGYEGLPIKDSYEPPYERIPGFAWTLSPEGKLTVYYQDNLDEFKNGTWDRQKYFWRATLDKDDQSDILDSPYFLDNLQSLVVQLPQIGSKYFVYLDSVPDGALPDLPSLPIKRTGFEVSFDGKVHSGSTLDCTDGMCIDYTEYVSCEELTDNLERIGCQLERHLATSPIGGSIAAVGTFVKGLVVPSQPVCNLPIGDFPFGSRMIYTGQLLNNGCEKAALFRMRFPIISILINGTMSLIIVFGVVGLINRLLRSGDDDILTVDD